MSARAGALVCAGEQGDLARALKPLGVIYLKIIYMLVRLTPMHTFELSGLGKAPFTIAHPLSAPADSRNIYWCEHCGTTIKNQNFVQSSDGKISVVGIDCLQKTGDSGLIAGESRLRRQVRAEQREAVRAEAVLKQEQTERARNGGKTNAEMADDQETALAVLMDEFRQEMDCHPLVQSMTRPGFARDMQRQAHALQPYSAGQLSAVINMHAKTLSAGARANSAKYAQALPRAAASVNALQARLIETSQVISRARCEIARLRLGAPAAEVAGDCGDFSP